MKKTTLDFNRGVTLLDGNLSEENLAQTLANAINLSKEGDALKLRWWAFDLYAKKPLELDQSDLELFRRIVESSTYLSVLSKGETLEIILAAK